MQSAGLMLPETKRLREPEQENARLKKIVADLSLGFRRTIPFGRTAQEMSEPPSAESGEVQLPEASFATGMQMRISVSGNVLVPGSILSPNSTTTPTPTIADQKDVVRPDEERMNSLTGNPDPFPDIGRDAAYETKDREFPLIDSAA